MSDGFQVEFLTQESRVVLGNQHSERVRHHGKGYRRAAE
jgi:hypothetical protein